MKNKRLFLLGIGTGLIIAALLLVMMDIPSFQAVAQQNAGQNSLQNPIPNTNQNSQQSGDTQQSGDAQQSGVQGIHGEEPSQEPSSAQNDSPNTKVIVVHPGMTSYDIARLLESENLIDDKEKFDAYIYEQGAAYRLQTGRYVMQVGWDYAQILAKLLEGD